MQAMKNGRCCWSTQSHNGNGLSFQQLFFSPFESLAVGLQWVHKTLVYISAFMGPPEFPAGLGGWFLAIVTSWLLVSLPCPITIYVCVGSYLARKWEL